MTAKSPRRAAFKASCADEGAVCFDAEMTAESDFSAHDGGIATFDTAMTGFVDDSPSAPDDSAENGSADGSLEEAIERMQELMGTFDESTKQALRRLAER